MNVEVKFGSDRKKYLFKDNEKIGVISRHLDSISKLELDIHNLEDLNEISKELLISLDIQRINIPIDFKKYPNLDWLDKSAVVFLDFELPNQIYSRLNILNWKKPYSILDFLKLFEKYCLNDPIIDFKIDDNEYYVENGFIFYLNSNENFIKIKKQYYSILNEFNSLTLRINDELNNNIEEKSLKSTFNFPPEIQNSCEQYLIYFSKFLEDIGISASSKIESHAQNTLFTVTPTNSEQALSKIKDALNIYLSLPQMTNIQSLAQNYNDIGVQQLVSNILHLNSQIVLANSIMEVKDATISSLKFTNYQQSLIIEKETNEEKILDGLLTIKELEGKGFKINLPEIFRRIKRRLI